MSAIEYLVAINCFIFGWVTTLFLDGWAVMIQNRRTVKLYDRHLAWTCVGGLSVSQAWWALFGVTNQIDDNFFAYFICTVPAISCFLSATILFPPKKLVETGKAFSYKLYVQKNYKVFYGSVAALHMVAIFFQWYFTVLTPKQPWPIALRILYLLAILWGIKSKRSRHYYDFLLVGSAVFLAFSIYTRWHLPITE